MPDPALWCFLITGSLLYTFINLSENGCEIVQLAEVVEVFYRNRDPERAAAMAAYMKDRFPYLGIGKPVRAKLQSSFFKESRRSPTIDWDLISRLWALPEREFQYLALDYLLSLKQHLGIDDLDKLKTLVLRKSWWDTVDLLASHAVGSLCLRHPSLIRTHILEWAGSDNIWLARTAILFQLKYKEITDTQVLEQVIDLNLNSREFFINKAIGWALREYSKSNPEWVRNYLAGHRLQPLSVREASKYL